VASVSRNQREWWAELLLLVEEHRHSFTNVNITSSFDKKNFFILGLQKAL
jgi:hypothetical protein